jgi:GxxExxY protein
LNQLTEKIIGSAFKVLNTLGVGFLEHVYENALVHELIQMGILAEPQQSVEVYYDGIVVGEFFPDILVNKTVIVEVKPRRITTKHLRLSASTTSRRQASQFVYC